MDNPKWFSYIWNFCHDVTTCSLGFLNFIFFWNNLQCPTIWSYLFGVRDSRKSTISKFLNPFANSCIFYNSHLDMKFEFLKLWNRKSGDIRGKEHAGGGDPSLMDFGRPKLMWIFCEVCSKQKLLYLLVCCFRRNPRYIAVRISCVCFYEWRSPNAWLWTPFVNMDHMLC